MSDIIKLAVHVEVDAIVEELAGVAEQRGSVQAAKAFAEGIGYGLWNYFEQDDGIEIIRALIKVFAAKYEMEPALCLPERNAEPDA